MVIAMTMAVSYGYSQEIPQSQVPSLVVNSFKQQFPKASDIEWEIKGELYDVDFETGFFTDHEAWYDKEGKRVKYKKDIKSSELPKPILTAVKKDFSEYRIDDAEKIEENDSTTYKVELDKFSEDLKIIFNEDGKILKQWAD